MQQDENFDPVQAERSQINSLLEKGNTFSIKKYRLLAFFSKNKFRKFTIKEPYLGTLDLMAAEFLQMRLDEQKLKAEFLNESRLMTKDDSKPAAKVVALAVLNDYWAIKFLLPFFTKYFLWFIKPSDLKRLAIVAFNESNLPDFIDSIRLMSIKERLTAPNLVETTSQEQENEDQEGLLD